MSISRAHEARGDRRGRRSSPLGPGRRAARGRARRLGSLLALVSACAIPSAEISSPPAGAAAADDDAPLARPARREGAPGVTIRPEPGPLDTAGSTGDGDGCEGDADCPADHLCEGEGCAPGQGVCVPRSRMCTRDRRAYCGCDGETFGASSSCPGRRYAHRGECGPP